MKITIEKTDSGYSATVDDRFADHLTVDEALGVVASALFSSGKPLFVRTAEEQADFDAALGLIRSQNDE